MTTSRLSFIGFLQAVGLVVYCLLIAVFFQYAEKFIPRPTGFFVTAFMLFLFVFSAAVTGSLVFGYPAYLALNQHMKEALTVFGFTLLYCLAIIGAVVVILIVVV